MDESGIKLHVPQLVSLKVITNHIHTHTHNHQCKGESLLLVPGINQCFVVTYRFLVAQLLCTFPNCPWILFKVNNFITIYDLFSLDFAASRILLQITYVKRRLQLCRLQAVEVKFFVLSRYIAVAAGNIKKLCISAVAGECNSLVSKNAKFLQNCMV